MQNFDIKRIEDGFAWLEKEFEQTAEVQSIDLLINKMDALNSCIAWAGQQMAIAKVDLNKAKVATYNTLVISSVSQQKYFAPSLAKEYVNAKCHKEEYNYDLSERFCRALVHISENLRTAISALKQEALLSGYSQRVPNY